MNILRWLVQRLIHHQPVPITPTEERQAADRRLQRPQSAVDRLERLANEYRQYGGEHAVTGTQILAVLLILPFPIGPWACLVIWRTMRRSPDVHALRGQLIRFVLSSVQALALAIIAALYLLHRLPRGFGFLLLVVVLMLVSAAPASFLIDYYRPDAQRRHRAGQLEARQSMTAPGTLSSAVVALVSAILDVLTVTGVFRLDAASKAAILTVFTAAFAAASLLIPIFQHRAGMTTLRSGTH